MSSYDVIVVGAGHAGIEAALATSRKGHKTAIFTIVLENIGQMSCNPSIGGPAKSHLVKEIDALGGEMGRNMDKSFVQMRILNTKKGPAVRSLRAQADRKVYARNMKKTLEAQENLDIIQDMVVSITFDKDKKVVTGVKTKNGLEFLAKKVIIATGTFLNGLLYVGDKLVEGGRMGELSSKELTNSFIEMGLEIKRFKTGTSPRIDKRTIDFNELEEQPGETKIALKYSSRSSDEEVLAKPQLSCYLTRTNVNTHNLILDHIDKSPLYNGTISSIGPRYCPSIEDKIVKFRDKDSHHLFLEPEGFDTNEVYISGLSTSYPAYLQEQMVRSIKGMENARIMRYGYAVEYDIVNAKELDYTLEVKKIKGLYLAGQINGTSGYEEAAAQGLMAGINASLALENREPLILYKDNSYIATMIDDIITKEIQEPYRMFTARSEYRLLLREDNADLRLSKYGYEIGLLSKEEYDKVLEKEKAVYETIDNLSNTNVGTSNKVLVELLEKYNETIKSGISLKELLRRPSFTYQDVKEIARYANVSYQIDFRDDIEYQIEVFIKYEGYIDRAMKMMEKNKKLEEKKIPKDFNYDIMTGIGREAKQRLNEIRPYNIGQASRIMGVTPADISVLIMYLDGRLS
ncbi:tRNA uridine-5-carboxymethylaminomethyl(34) synthesis enzyme MnmG [Oceanivirga miroungae]|uniref:tRNA uridine 5-carboxymethylaminomethyl modification enzyme MnmG n=1 Tax=Oceanivirga miroungae TaxID=1130046 RepID=A0A6I8M9B2_9FUSO|nr:tRNA uridine-5-carboxymethylaminomethyl(34) synthesis enzyme MnmG [Oceanivirga miroungae]VWL85395.1 tRNA uridine 5-carboxymethylaminomethyl modification protein GidA [Oceanivirga miroungae]